MSSSSGPGTAARRRRARPPATGADHRSSVPEAFANDIESFLSYISLERGLSKNTVAAYRRDGLIAHAQGFAVKG